ncbi:MAG: hypothetical protein P8180_05190 [Gammaproteobacteria bacterium]
MEPKGPTARGASHVDCGPSSLYSCTLPNHRLLCEQLHELMALARAGQQPLGLLLLGLDAAAVSVRRLLAASQHRMISAMQRLLGESDILVRLDDLDYAVLLAGACTTEAQLIAASLLAALQTYGAASAGTAVYPDDGTDAAALIDCAGRRRASVRARTV